MFIFPSQAFENWAEAMACGLPVVCFNNTSASDYISHKLNGSVDNVNPGFEKRIDWMAKKIMKN